MGGFAAVVLYAAEIAVIAAVAYFVIRKAVRDALRDHDNETNHRSGG